MIRHRVLALVAIACCTASPALAQDDTAFVNLPITRAVLFSSSVGYFEHVGVVREDAVMRIMFKTDQINDVLKSMVLMDYGGGAVTGVTYAANDPLERALKSFGVDISDNPSLPELLDQLRGATVIVQTPDRVEGKILNVETREKIVLQGGSPSTVQEHVLNLVTQTGIRSLPMTSLDAIQFADHALREELNRALLLLVSSRDTDQKPVDIRFTGSGERTVRVGYLVETPVWKTSYRLDLTDDKNQILQGWAIVENTSNNDWKSMRLSLVSGRPISFVQDLYTPLYMPRPIVRPQLYASLMPKMYEGGISRDDVAMMGRVAVAPTSAPPTPGRAGPAGSGSMRLGVEADVAWDAGQGITAAADAASVGELFQFTLQHPVDLARRRSSMLPIVNQPVTTERLSIYNTSVLAKHPLNGVMLTNSTNLKLLAGPVTVFDGASYAGDAQLDHLSPGEKRLLSYAVDLDVEVDSATTSTSRMTDIRINRGVLRVTHATLYTQAYTLKNKSQRDRTVIVEHPFNAQRELVEPEQFEEKTPSLYRFRVNVPTGKSHTLNVRERHTTLQSISLLQQQVGSFQAFITNSEIKPEVRKALERAAALKNRLSEAEALLAQQMAELREIQDGQERLRQNLAAVGAETTLGKRYLARLNEDEDNIERLQRDIMQTRNLINERRAELQAYLDNLEVS